MLESDEQGIGYISVGQYKLVSWISHFYAPTLTIVAHKSKFV